MDNIFPADLAKFAAEEGEVRREVLAILYIAIGLFGMIGNILTIIVMSTDKKVKNVGNIFVINLALADLCTATLSSLMLAANLWSAYKLFQEWPVFMYIHYFGLADCIPVSIAMVTLIGLDR